MNKEDMVNLWVVASPETKRAILLDTITVLMKESGFLCLNGASNPSDMSSKSCLGSTRNEV